MTAVMSYNNILYYSALWAKYFVSQKKINIASIFELLFLVFVNPKKYEIMDSFHHIFPDGAGIAVMRPLYLL